MSITASLCLFADRLPPLYGGMENHALHMVRFFRDHPMYPLVRIITRKQDGLNCVIDPAGRLLADGLDAATLGDHLCQLSGHRRVFCFFNSGRWIEELPALRQALPSAMFCQRTGGNDIIQAALSDLSLLHRDRQARWVSSINLCVDAFITNSTYTSDRVTDLGVREELIHQISGGVDAARCRVAIRHREALRRRYFGELHAAPCVVSSSRLVRFKGVDTALAAVRLARREATLAFFIVGDGPEEEALRLAAAGSPSGTCVFLGGRSADESLEIISAADVFLCLSREWLRDVPGGGYLHTETMGRGALEAICVGTPVVASRVGGLPEFVTPSRGAFVDPDDPAGAAFALLEIVRARRERPGNLEGAWDAYSWDRIFARYMEIWGGA